MEKLYDFKQAEPELQRYWEREQIYRFDPGAPGEVYSIDTPPPTVSGRLHIGHLFSYTQTEMIARYRRMQGYNVFYPFGFDDNGLPTERLVEREQNLRAKDLPRREFSALCAKTARAYEAEFRELWKSMGFSADWALGYETSGPEMQALSQKLFLELVSAGRAYLKESPGAVVHRMPDLHRPGRAGEPGTGKRVPPAALCLRRRGDSRGHHPAGAALRLRVFVRPPGR